MLGRKTTKTNVTRRLALAIAFALAFGLVTPVAPVNQMSTVQAAIAADTEVPIITAGYGTIKKTLTTNEEATVVVDDCLMTVTVGSDKLNYLSNKIADEDARRVVGKAVVSDDDLLHFLHLDGKYYVMDLRYSSFTIVEAWRSNSTHKYVAKDPSTSYEVHGFAITSNTQFKEVTPGTVDDKTVENLMTRAEFEAILNPANGGNGDNGNGNSGDNGNNGGNSGDNGNNGGNSGDNGNNGGNSSDNGNNGGNSGDNGNNGGNSSDNETTQPTVTNLTGDALITWWLNRYIDGTITWDQLQTILAQYNYTGKKETTSKSTTYYFYDDKDRLIKEETVTTGVEDTKGNATVTATVKDDGAATVKVTDKENGESTIKVVVESTTTPGSNSSASADASTVIPKANQWITNDGGETYYHVKRKGKKVQLQCRKAKKTGCVCSVYFNKKKGIAKFDGIRYKNIAYVGYTQITAKGAKQKKTHQIIMITKKGKVYIVPRTKGLINRVYTKKVLSGKWYYATEDGAGLCIRVSDKKSKVKGVKNAQPKRLK